MSCNIQAYGNSQFIPVGSYRGMPDERGAYFYSAQQRLSALQANNMQYQYQYPMLHPQQMQYMQPPQYCMPQQMQYQRNDFYANSNRDNDINTSSASSCSNIKIKEDNTNDVAPNQNCDCNSSNISAASLCTNDIVVVPEDSSTDDSNSNDIVVTPDNDSNDNSNSNDIVVTPDNDSTNDSNNIVVITSETTTINEYTEDIDIITYGNVDVHPDEEDALTIDEQAEYDFLKGNSNITMVNSDIDLPISDRMDVGNISGQYAVVANEALDMYRSDISGFDKIKVVLESRYNNVSLGTYLSSLRHTGLAGQAIKVYNATMDRVGVDSNASDNGLNAMLSGYDCNSCK